MMATVGQCILLRQIRLRQRQLRQIRGIGILLSSSSLVAPFPNKVAHAVHECQLSVIRSSRQATCPIKQVSDEYMHCCVRGGGFPFSWIIRPERSLQDLRPPRSHYQQLLLTVVNMVLHLHNRRPALCQRPPFQVAQQVPT